MTLAEEIIAKHARKKKLHPGDVVRANVDRIYLQDGNTPTIAGMFRKYGLSKVFDPARIACFFDHAVLSNSVHITNRIREAESFIDTFKLQLFKSGQGISHVVALEQGWYEPGNLVIGSDSHTCTGGVVQSLSLGMGATDVTYAMVSGTTWLRVPETVYIRVEGKSPSPSGAKDLMLHLLSQYGQEPFLDKSIEWTGTFFDDLSLDSSCTIANMAVEMGAKCAFLPPGKYRNAPGMRPIIIKENNLNPAITIDASKIQPVVSKPHSPFLGTQLDSCSGQKINYVFIGSCANGRLEDLEEASRIFKQHGAVHQHVHCMIAPASKEVYSQAIKKGIITALIEAGAVISPPGCGACVGTQGIVPADDDHVFSTMNRNFIGRMGNRNSKIWLGSPTIAAYTAIFGYIPSTADIK